MPPRKHLTAAKRVRAATRRQRGTYRKRGAFEDRLAQLEIELTQAQMTEETLRLELARTKERLDYYSQHFNSEPVGSLLLTAAGIIRDANDAAAALLHCERNALIGESFTRFISTESFRPYLANMRGALAKKKPICTELVLRLPGGLLPVEMVTNPVAAQPLRPPLHRVALIDVSERQRAERDLQDTQMHYRVLINSIDGIVWESGADGREFTFVSRQAEKMLGYPIDRWLRERAFWTAHLHADDQARVVRERALAIAEGVNFVEEFRMLSIRGEVVWLRNNVTLLTKEEGRLALQGIMVNVTDLKIAEEALREERRALETLHRIGTSLVAELDLEKLVTIVTEAGKEVTGAKFAAFSYKAINGRESAGDFVLHTSGASRETFKRLPWPEHKRTIPPAQAEREIIRIQDMLQGGRLPGKARGRSKAPHPVRSYLAVPVVSRSGETLGGLLFGHPEPGIFTERAQHLVAGIAAEAGIALDNARLYHSITKSEAHFRELAEAMPQIVWSAGPNGKFQYFNSRWFAYTGQQELARVKPWPAYLAGEHTEECVCAWEESIKSGQALQLECRLRGRDSPEGRWHLIRAEPIKDAAGRIARWFGTCTDIEQQKHTEQEVRELNAALEKRVQERTAQLTAANSELEAFCYSVSHDLRAPLRSIDAFSQLVREDYGDRLDPQGIQYLNTVAEASRQMARLIDDLLHLSRVTRTEMYRQPVSLTAMAEQIIAGYRQLEPKRQVEVVIAPDLNASGDGRLLRIVVENLLSNAWKFTSKKPSARIEFGVQVADGKSGDNAGAHANGNGNGNGEVAAAGKVRAGEKVFFVRDDGAGFDMQYAGKLFGAFQRLHSGDDFPGHGVGLATVQRIVNRHGGTIWAESALGEGATFYFTLPESAA